VKEQGGIIIKFAFFAKTKLGFLDLGKKLLARSRGLTPKRTNQ
jgi:hypothetical protein